ncbi:hypothetical protein Ancab_038020 [Ancistrocladus abbreviatus]
MDASQWPQQQLQPMDELPQNTNSSRLPTAAAGNMLERRAAASRPQKEQNLSCPRCNSTNTKFCYYNNYSLTQPRYFCKTCRRYWTQGGSLRNVPVGGGSRKNKRSTPSSSAATNASSSSGSTLATSSPSSTKQQLIIPDLNPPTTFTQLITAHHHHHHQNSSKIHHHQGQDLNLAFPTTQDYQGIFQPVELPKIQINSNNNCQPISESAPTSCSSASTTSSISALELLRSGIASRGLNPYIPVPMPDSNTLYPSGFPLQEFKPSLSFSADGIGARVGNLLGVEENSGARLLFPFGEMKQLANTTTEVDQSKGSHEGTSGYWNGMLGGGTW